MEIQRNHQLKQGTILDGRYEIGSVLGEGGFGITYAGTNRITGERVAIKEFFCREYMGRADDGTGRTVLVADDVENRFNDERRRFLREARIVKDFKNAPSIVSMKDYFECNDTAYIVMELIEGDTLRSYVHEHGKYAPETLFEEIRPLIESLHKLHNAGIIHRDISPDNIIRRKGGQLVLIDFGSARNLSSNTLTVAAAAKDGYAPPEQYSAGSGSAVTIDIYGICATLYYCLTKSNPPSSMQRIIYDDLRPVSEKSAVPKSIDEMIAKGMELRPADRYKSLSDMLPIIEEAYPYLSPEEKVRERRKKQVRMLAATVIVVMLGIGTFQLLQAFSGYLMRMHDTANIHFTWENEEQAKQMEPLLNRKIDAFFGEGKYESYVKGNEIIARIPVNQFSNDQLPVEIARIFLAPKFSNIILYPSDETGGVKMSGEGEDSVPERQESFLAEDIEAMSIGSEEIPIGQSSTAKVRHLSIVINDKAAAGAGSMLSEPGTLLLAEIGYGKDTITDYVFSSGDGRTMYLVDQDACYEDSFYEMLRCSTEGEEDKQITVTEKEGGDIYAALMEGMSKTQDGYILPSRCYSESLVKWKSTLSGFGTGKNQCRPEEVDGEYTVFEVSTYENTLNTDNGRETVKAIKNRLDALEIPYAFGTDYYNSGTIAIKMQAKQLYISEAALLEESDNVTITNGFTTSMLSSQSISKPTSGEIGIKAIIKYRPECEKMVRQSETYGMENIYLKYGKIPIARIDTESFRNQLSNSEVIFTEFCTEEINEDEDRKNRHIEYVLAVINNKPVSIKKTEKMEFFNKDGELEEEGGYYSFDGTFLSALENAFIDPAKAAENAAYDMTEMVSEYSLGLKVEAFVNTDSFERQTAQMIKEFIDNNELYTNDYQLGTITFKFSNSKDRDNEDAHINAVITMEAKPDSSTTDVKYAVSEVKATVSDSQMTYDMGGSIKAEKQLRSELSRINIESTSKEGTL